MKYFSEAVFAAMREIDADAQHRLRRGRELSPRQGEIAAGGAHMGYFIPGEALAEFLRVFRRGVHPDAAAAAAKVYAREMVTKWNKHRGGDYHTHRSECTADATIDHAWRRVTALTPIESPSIIPPLPCGIEERDT